MNLTGSVRQSCYIKIYGDAPMKVRTSPDEIEIGYDGDLDLVLTHLAATKLHDHLVEYLASIA